MSGYIRQDVSNRISNGSVIDADDLDLEFNAVSAAFNNTTGHTHDGSSGEGSPITVIGPAQDVITSASQIIPKTSNTYDLGSATNKWKDLYVDGVAYVDTINLNGTAVTSTSAELNLLDGVTSTTAELNILDGVTATAAEINALDGITATVTELNYTDGVTSNIQTQLNNLSANKQALDAGLTSISGLTTSADKMIYTTASDVYAVATLTAAGRALLDDVDNAAQLVTLGLTATATEINTLDGITSSTAELNILDGATLTTTELNYVDGVTSAIQTQLNNKQGVDSDLTAISNLTTTGLIVRTGTGTAATRAIAAGTGLTVADGTGASGNPTLSADLASQAEAEAGTDNTKVMTPLRVRNALNATGSAPTYACRAWVNFNGIGTVYIRASGNVSSITDNGVGLYTVNFTTAMPDTNYCVTGTAAHTPGAGINKLMALANTSRLVGSCGIITGYPANNTTGVIYDGDITHVAIFR